MQASCWRIDNAGHNDAGVEILANFLVNLRPAIIGRTDFNDQLWRRPIPFGNRIPWDFFEAVEGDIRSADGIRITLRNDSAVVSNHAPQFVLLNMISQDSR